MATKQATKNYQRIPAATPMPDLIEIQLDSFALFQKEGIGELLAEISPIESYTKGMKLYFPAKDAITEEWGLKFWFGESKFTVDECLERDMTYSKPLYVTVLLAGAEVSEPIRQDIFLGDFPEMTENGTFIINGSERVVVSQLIRSPGVYFEASLDRTTGHRIANAKLIPDRGAWMGYKVIIAHPERYIAIQRDITLAEELVHMGCELQASTDFIAGGRLGAEKRPAKRMLKAGLYSYLASDAHVPKHYRYFRKAYERYGHLLRKR